MVSTFGRYRQGSRALRCYIRHRREERFSESNITLTSHCFRLASVLLPSVPFCVCVCADVHAMEPDTEACNPETLLCNNWFDKRNAAKLRDYLRALICELMLARVHAAEDADRRQLLQAVVSDYQEKPCA